MGETFSLDYNIVKWEDFVYYDETSPTFLRWKSGAYKKDKSAGSLCKTQNYSSIRHKGNDYKIHRIVWVLFYGSIDNTLIIDHIDGNRSNNNINNIRIATRSLNSRNTKIKSTNNTGIKGICLRNIDGYDNYVVQWSKLDGKRGSKSFSCNFYGYSIALELAKDFRFKKMEELNNLGEGYTERHIYGG